MKEQVYKAILITEELHTKLKVKTSTEKKKINAVVEELITNYLNDKSKN